MSDKPANNYGYTLGEDAKLIWDFVTKIVPLKDFILFSHDRGDSVVLNFLQLYQAAKPVPDECQQLPLANLTDFQKAMLNPATSAMAVKSVTPERLAEVMGATQYSPPLKDGIQVIPGTIQYLNERKQLEVTFLEALAKSDVPVTLL